MKLYLLCFAYEKYYLLTRELLPCLGRLDAGKMIMYDTTLQIKMIR